MSDEPVIGQVDAEGNPITPLTEVDDYAEPPAVAEAAAAAAAEEDEDA